jgi:hypothetical protein
MQHPHCDILTAIARGETVQWRSNDGTWHDQNAEMTLREIGSDDFPPDRYRVKPKTIQINGHEVPEPASIPPKFGQKYFLPDLTSESGASSMTWTGDHRDLGWFRRGIVHLDVEAAKQVTTATLSFFKIS